MKFEDILFYISVKAIFFFFLFSSANFPHYRENLIALRIQLKPIYGSATQYRSCCDHRDVYTAYLPSVQIFNLSELVCGCRVLHFPIIRRIYSPLFRKESRIKYLFTHTRACRSIKSRGRRLEQTVRGEFRRAISVD